MPGEDGSEVRDSSSEASLSSEHEEEHDDEEGNVGSISPDSDDSDIGCSDGSSDSGEDNSDEIECIVSDFGNANDDVKKSVVKKPKSVADAVRDRKLSVVAFSEEGSDTDSGSSDNSKDDASSSQEESDSAGDDDDEDDEDDHHGETTTTDAEGRKLSAYEQLRMERIKRNRAKLASLGLENDPAIKVRGGGKIPRTLLSPLTADIDKKKRERAEAREETRRKNSAAQDVVQRRLPSRSARQNVNYAELAIRGEKDEEKTKKVKEKGEPMMTAPANDWKKNLGRKANERMPLFVYREFKRMEKERNYNLKTAEKQMRSAEVEHRYAKKHADVHFRKVHRREEQERRRNEYMEMVEERNLMSSLFQELDMKKRQLYETRAKYDWTKQVCC